MYRKLITLAMLLTFGLVMLGAYVRLSDAGLGCPDWPGCYGRLSPVQAHEDIAQAVVQQGGEHGPVSMGKAWREMVHRYLASFVGLLIVVIAAIAVRQRSRLRQSPGLSLALVGVVVLQGLFGKWTVTLLLKPAIVTGHLIGGMLTFVLLVWLWMRQRARVRYLDAEPVSALRGFAVLGLGLLALQVVLGGWTSTNYAALACTDLPTCHGQWWPQVEFGEAFQILRPLGQTRDGQMLPAQALTAIHLAHRIGAVIVGGYLLWLGLRVAKTPGVRAIGAAMLALLALQIALGLSNVLLSLPLPVAVAHNGVAALLLASLVVLNFRVSNARLQI